MEEKKLKIKSSYVKLGLSVFVAGIGLLLCYYLLYNTNNVFEILSTINGILTPFYIGIIMAYLLCPVYNRTLRYVYKTNRGRFGKYTRDYKLARLVATFMALMVLLFVIVGFLMLIIPELVNSIVGLVSDIPQFVEHFTEWVQKHIAQNPELAALIQGRVETASETLLVWAQENVIPGAEAILAGVSEGIMNTFATIVDLLVSLVICVYILNSKEIFQAQARKFILAVFSPKKADDIFEFGRICNETFGGFINGKIIDSIIIGIICFIAMNLLGLPLAVLISVVVGVTNIIPFFGPFIGAIPSVILLLFISPWDALEFGIMVLVLQQVDGNIIGPKILGKTTKLASFWVMFAILVGGGLFGFVGMVLGVPTMAVFYVYMKRMINGKLAARDLPTRTEVYEDLSKYEIDKEDIFGKEACISVERDKDSPAEQG